ncbi:MAG: aminotransferase class V-fold PLP-dependent enzyme [Clostridiales bacterium]|nr:aminotransferase class V-fold PLP-dependent enzyme [Clostridiales bacterium]
MNTPICDFVKNYISKKPLRFHMPGHKGKNLLGFEKYDITEINGADSLFQAKSIIKESENNASKIFNAHTFYSCEGSSLSIKAMVYLALLWGRENNRAPLILAGRNAHKSFLNACALNDTDVLWLKSKEESYLSCNIDIDFLEDYLKSAKVLPCAVYITSPDYLGNITDLCTIAQICKKYKVLFLVDNAHGAYLNFLNMHPLNFGADLVCDSAHKTLPVLTGGGYLHISKKAPKTIKNNVKDALSLFASTSPSYLILQSLDKFNGQTEKFKKELNSILPHIENAKNVLTKSGYTLYGNEPLKLTIKTKLYGYLGTEFSSILEKQNIFCEFSDPDFCVFMLTLNKRELQKLVKTLLKIKQKSPIEKTPPVLAETEKVLSPREALFSPCETVKIKNALNRILAMPSVSCPPAVPIISLGEKINESAIEAFKYYGIKEVKVTKEG